MVYEPVNMFYGGSRTGDVKNNNIKIWCHLALICLIMMDLHNLREADNCIIKSAVLEY